MDRVLRCLSTLNSLRMATPCRGSGRGLFQGVKPKSPDGLNVTVPHTGLESGIFQM
jgi:hypothetical protein